MSQGRWWALDAARGLAVLAMVVFHVIWDLAHFGYAPANLPWSAPVRIFGHSIAFAFLFIAGVALVLANRDSMRWPAFWRRFALIAAAAALVTAGTYALFPTSYVFFGILHCIAAASLIAVPFLFAPWPIAFACGAFFLLGGEFFASSAFNADWLQWIGLSTSEPMTQDWRPLFPWAGALLLGVAAAKLALPVYGNRAGVSGEGANPLPTRSKREWLPFLGRHSLLIYLAHQPALFALFMGLAYLIPPAVDATEFVASCEARCMNEGGEGKICHDACACTAREAISSKALAGVTDEAERGRRLNEIAQRCVAGN
ncbi:heparan-alpha-glucosaminide N-acetyltransferase [Methylocystis rosea]|uniref:heparan-alpha-glucosaminide N-acetyltransferase n=1 Tax=Methylocystis rosea TaxID=173366 RepID=UPI00036B9A56|nr:heparan-alpha-glucosaminide N-acetyltransferase [Methylocystis rosea]